MIYVGMGAFPAIAVIDGSTNKIAGAPIGMTQWPQGIGVLAKRNFIYVSGMGTDSKGRAMWARVKGETEDALLALPLRAYMMRPGFIQPMHGIRSRTRLYALLYVVAAPLFPILRRLFPNAVTTTGRVGRAMIELARSGAQKRVLESRDINAVAARLSSP